MNEPEWIGKTNPLDEGEDKLHEMDCFVCGLGADCFLEIGSTSMWMCAGCAIDSMYDQLEYATGDACAEYAAEYDVSTHENGELKGFNASWNGVGVWYVEFTIEELRESFKACFLELATGEGDE